MSKDKAFARQCARNWWGEALSQSYATPGIAVCDSCDAAVPRDEGFLCNPLDAPDVDFILEGTAGGLQAHVEWQEWIPAACKRGGLPGCGTKRIGGLPGPHLVCETCFDQRRYAPVEPNFYFWYLAERGRSLRATDVDTPPSAALAAAIDTIAGLTEPAATTGGMAGPFGLASTPHQRADPNRAMKLNLEYQQAHAAWKALPWWKRIVMTAPEPPRGI